MERVKAEQLAASAAEDLVDSMEMRLRFHFQSDAAYEEFVKKVEQALTPILEGVST